jgi:hypothetical protein
MSPRDTSPDEATKQSGVLPKLTSPRFTDEFLKDAPYIKDEQEALTRLKDNKNVPVTIQ